MSRHFDVEEELCGTCGGTGEGRYEGLSCFSCGGTGVAEVSVYDEEVELDEEEWNEYVAQTGGNEGL